MAHFQHHDFSAMDNSHHSFTPVTPHNSTHDGLACNFNGAAQACNQGMGGAVTSGATAGALTGSLADGVGAFPGAVIGGTVGGLSNCIGNVTNHLNGCW